jgi:hypothetical protein
MRCAWARFSAPGVNGISRQKNPHPRKKSGASQFVIFNSAIKYDGLALRLCPDSVQLLD